MRKLRGAVLFSLIPAALACDRAPAELTFLVPEPKASFGLSGAELIQALDEANQAWRRTCTRHTFPALRFHLISKATPVVRDGKNAIRVLTGRFCPDSARDMTDCYESRRAAITHIYPLLDGTTPDFVSRMPEMDIELNAADFDWKKLGREKLMTVLVHELGHAFGLKHSCKFPECNETTRSMVMYPYPLDEGKPPTLMPTDADCDILTENERKVTLLRHH